MEEPEYKKWYKTAHWQKMRKLWLDEHPFCVRCLTNGLYVAANVVNHKIAHKGDWKLFNNWSNLESVCKQCHDTVIQSEEKRGYSTKISADGWPVDDEHPFNKEGE